MAKTTSVLCIFDEPAMFSHMLEQRFPDVTFSYATDADGVLSALAGGGPDVAFSIKHPGFPGELQAPILRATNLKWLQIGGSGYEQFVPWDKDRVVLTNAAGVLSRFLAETVTGAILTLNSGFLTYLKQQQARTWKTSGFYPVSDKTLLIVGAGAIGGYVADNCKALGMTVLGVRDSGRPHPSVDEMHTPDQLDALLPRADIVSLHIRANDETQGLIDARRFGLMKHGVIFVNTARGAVVDEQALIRALTSGQVASAYLDVFEKEPLPQDSPLWGMDNVLLTPHASDAVMDWPVRLAFFFADNLERWLSGEPMVNVLTA